MKKFKRKETILPVLAVLLLFLAVLYQHFANEQDTLKILQQAEPTTASYKPLIGEYPSYQLLDAKRKLLGYGVIADASGYGGKLTILSIVDQSGQIKKIVLLKDYETPVYLNKVVAAGLLDKITGRNVEGGLAHLDAVTGATVTSEAILAAVQKGTIQIGDQQLGLHIPTINKVNFNWRDIAALILVLLAIIGSVLNVNKLRPWLLASAVILIGFILNDSITYSNYVSLLTGNLPVFIERPIWYVFVPGILLITFACGRNFYCTWLCPFRGVQEGIYRSLNLYRFSPSNEIQLAFHRLRWPMLWVVAMVALISSNPGIAGYEPFTVFFAGIGNTAQWIILAIVVLMSMVQIHFWCNNFCAVGLLLNSTAHLRQRLIQSKKGIHLEEQINSNACPNMVHFPNSSRKRSINNQDKLYMTAASAVYILILVSILSA